MTEINKTTVPETPVEVIVTPSKSKVNIQLVVIIVLSLSLVSLGFAYAYNLGKQTKPIVIDTVSPTSIPTPQSTVIDSSEYGALTWLSAPKKVDNPNILAGTTPDGGGFAFADIGTYQVGTFKNGGSLLVTFISPEGPSSPMVFRLIFDKNKYYLIESLISDDFVKKNLDFTFDKNKVKFISYQIKELFPDPYYYINSINFSKVTDGFFLPQFVTSLKDSATVATTPVGGMLSTYSLVNDFADLSMRNYYLKLKDFTLVPFNQVSPLGMGDDRVPNFKLSDNTQNKNVFGPVRVGCGGGGSISVVKNNSLLNDKSLIGKSGDLGVFQVKSSSSALVKYLYNSYKQGREYPGAPPIISIDQFANSSNHILYQEKTGDWILLTNPEYSVQAECGKPVIYLYPQKDTQVTVQVGASITKSEPTYPQNGWTVLAHPNSQLDYQNNTYPNLFWEGTGQGIYTNHAGQGFVVAQSKLTSTIISQLKQQGLNNQETADFMEFWQSKLPQTPYVRLTWLDTADMNVLAPLSVNPHPNTVIRVFLEFEGLDKFVSLKPQKLSAPTRSGFTLVEWGGLLLK